ncbi:MAG: adventurous gliding motility lipoprotein CglB [Archangiaceae bacterium]|nr:adventurous gliding motility lipoprotein CglB [Archangiaceae bacterium]
MSAALKTVLSLVVVVVAASCQTYDFEPVTPLAIAQTTQTKNVTAMQLKPDLMILLDKSGSMGNPINPVGSCASCVYPNCNEGSCPTRIGQMRQAMNTFLNNNGNVARMGLTIFPADSACTPAGSGQLLTAINPASDNDADLQSWASSINSQIQGSMTTPTGGTPTGASLAFTGTVKELSDPLREDFVLLLTDGLPNCNPNNPNTCLSGSGVCRCTLAAGQCATMMSSNDQNFCIRGCLDLDGSVQAVKDLRTRGIRTIVVGFGSDFGGGPGFEVLNAMAIAGGFQRTCPMGTNAECGTGGMCDTASGVCQTAFYSAANQAELVAALAQISAGLSGDSICRYTLEAVPSSSDLVSVIIDGEPKQSGNDTWALEGAQIVMKGALCTKLQNSNTQNPVKVEIRIVQSL